MSEEPFDPVFDLNTLKLILENPEMYKYYRRFVPGEVIDAYVKKYPHPEGYRVYGSDERWWIYVKTKYVVGDTVAEYDISLRKLMMIDEVREKIMKAVVDENLVEN